MKLYHRCSIPITIQRRRGELLEDPLNRPMHLPVDTLALTSFCVLILAAIGACTGSPETEIFPKISDHGQIITVSDLMSTGFKQYKEYSNDGLPGATYVSYGFFRFDNGDPYDYEVRFYNSHREAVELGTSKAIEGSGKNAVLDRDEATYKEGVKNRRHSCGSGVGGGGRSSICVKFGSYAIFGNIVMLCQGSSEMQSIERCGLLAGALMNRG